MRRWAQAERDGWNGHESISQEHPAFPKASAGCVSMRYERMNTASSRAPGGEISWRPSIFKRLSVWFATEVEAILYISSREICVA